MGKRFTIVAVVAVAILLAGIAFAVSRLYGPVRDSSREEAPAGWSVLQAVPSDATAVLVFDGSARAARLAADSTGIIRSLIAPGNPALMRFVQALGQRRCAVALLSSGSLVPLVVAQVQPADSLLAAPAAAAGLRLQQKDGFLMACRSETFLHSSQRHLEEGTSVLGTRNLQALVAKVSGPAVLLLSHSHAPKLVDVYGATRMRRRASLVKDLTAWSAWSIQEPGSEQMSVKVTALPGEAAGSWLAAFGGVAAPQGTFPEALPYFTSSALCLPIASLDDILAARRLFEDGNGRLPAFNKALRTRAGRELTPEQWLRSLQPRELVRASFRLEGVGHEVLLVRCGRDLKGMKESANPYSGTLAALIGEPFNVTDTLCAPVAGHWMVFGDQPSVRAFADKDFLDYSLKDRLSDASVSVPHGFCAYASLSDEPGTVTEVVSGELSSAVLAFVRGSGYAPAFASLDVSGALPEGRISLEKRALKGTKVQVLERDTTVVVPTGYFPVQNFATGKTNHLYQNNHLSICLNDENGKGVWGIPFKEPLCGRVQSIDYFANGKIQFLFAAGSRLYLLDRLGHWVNGFPVELGKPVLLGPDTYDFTGAGGYTVMVLHKDNTLERYNLHGKKPEGWKGIRAPETVKNLPELLEVKEKRFWAVRTSVRTLIYPFEGGAPLTAEEGGKMIKPDARLTVTAKGVSAECYDNKVREFKLN